MPRSLTYANVTATLALFVALGGTSYAAITLPKNSVGAAQIRAGAVASSEIKDRSIRLTDIAPSTRTSLHKKPGPAGPPGAQGPAGPSATRYFAAVTAGGVLTRGNATSGGNDGSVGSYTVGFPASMSGCVYSATLGTTDAGQTPAGRITVRDNAGRVGVNTFDAAGNPADLPFHLIVAC